MKQILSLWDACPQGGKHRRSVFLRLLLLVCLLATTQAGWADNTLFNVDFTDETSEEIQGSSNSAEFVAKAYDTYNMSFGVKSGSSGTINIKKETGLEFTGNNYNDYNCLAIPLTLTANNKVTVTITVSSGYVKYRFVSGSLPSTPSAGSGTNAPASGTTNTIEYTPTSAGNYVLYLGRSGASSGKVIKSIVITQVSSAATHTITLDDNGGTADGTATATEGSNTLTSITAPTYAGHTLVGYYEETACTNLVADASGNLQPNTSYTDESGNWNSESNQTLYAKWLTANNATFSNGEYTIGGSALDLSTLFSSTSDGTVTYTVANANSTGASISGTTFTATTAGTATVTASQAATSTYAAKELTATITVYANPIGSHTLTWEPNVNKSESSIGTHSKNSTSSNITVSNIGNYGNLEIEGSQKK